MQITVVFFSRFSPYFGYKAILIAGFAAQGIDIPDTTLYYNILPLPGVMRTAAA